MARMVYDLGGTWQRLIGGMLIDTVAVPGSYRPVGACELQRQFDLPPAVVGPESSGRCFLCTEGVLAAADFIINGTPVGTAGPWTPYRFEIPRGILRTHNTVQAVVRDVTEYFGGTAGRLFKAGLIRKIWLEETPACFISDICFRTSLSPDLLRAMCRVSVTLDGADAVPLECILSEYDTGKPVKKVPGSSGTDLEFDFDHPRLWSPDSPALYRMTVRSGGNDPDEAGDLVGFRRIGMQGNDFFLNDRRLILKGVCRHEFTESDGYVVPEATVRHELAMIKRAGFNFVRLVHTPQGPEVARIAAEIGLFVSEEPGACWNDLVDDDLTGPALEALRRLVVRDRNCPSVFAWLIYNECDPDIPYAKRAAALCRDLDPDRLVSFADCSFKYDEIKAMVREAALSFYGINMYDFQEDRYLELMRTLTDKPLVLTEWGGLCAVGNPRVMGRLCRMITKHTRKEEELRLAGCAFWVWADYEERGRGLPASPVGYTLEGLVDVDGNPKQELRSVAEMWDEMDHPRPPAVPAITVLANARVRTGNWMPVSLDMVAGDQSQPERELEEQRSRYPGRPPVFGELMVSGIPFDCRDAYTGRPLLLGPGREEIVIPVNKKVTAVAMLGHVALKGGYLAYDIKKIHSGAKAVGKPFGAPASDYQFVFEDRTVTEPLRHGIHLLRGNNIYRSWMIEPRSPETLPAVQSVVDPNFEVLRYNVWEKEFPQQGYLKEIRWTLKDIDSIQALLAITVKE